VNVARILNEKGEVLAQSRGLFIASSGQDVRQASASGERTGRGKCSATTIQASGHSCEVVKIGSSSENLRAAPSWSRNEFE